MLESIIPILNQKKKRNFRSYNRKCIANCREYPSTDRNDPSNFFHLPFRLKQMIFPLKHWNILSIAKGKKGKLIDYFNLHIIGIWSYNVTTYIQHCFNPVNQWTFDNQWMNRRNFFTFSCNLKKKKTPYKVHYSLQWDSLNEKNWHYRLGSMNYLIHFIGNIFELNWFTEIQLNILRII